MSETLTHSPPPANELAPAALELRHADPFDQPGSQFRVEAARPHITWDTDQPGGERPKAWHEVDPQPPQQIEAARLDLAHGGERPGVQNRWQSLRQGWQKTKEAIYKRTHDKVGDYTMSFSETVRARLYETTMRPATIRRNMEYEGVKLPEFYAANKVAMRALERERGRRALRNTGQPAELTKLGNVLAATHEMITLPKTVGLVALDAAARAVARRSPDTKVAQAAETVAKRTRKAVVIADAGLHNPIIRKAHGLTRRDVHERYAHAIALEELKKHQDAKAK